MQNSRNLKILFCNNKSFFSTFILILCFALTSMLFNINNLSAESNNKFENNNKFGNNKNTKNDILIKNSNLENIDLSFFPEIISIDSININAQLYLQPNIDGCYYIAEAGSPAELVKTILITVPDTNSFNIENYFVAGISEFRGKLIPVETTTFDRNTNTIETEYIVNQASYDSYKPSSWVKVEYYGITGNRHIAQITITVARYNSNKNCVEIPNQIDLTIKFNNSIDDNKSIDNSKTSNSNHYKQNIKDDIELTINHNETKNWLIRNNYFDNKNNFDNRNNFDKNGNQFQAETIQCLDEISDGEWLRLTILNEGVHRVTASELAARGINIPREKVNTIKIYGQSGQPMSEAIKNANELKLNEQAIIVKTNSDGSLSSIIFYASAASGFHYNNAIRRQAHYLNYMDSRNYYLLTFGKTEGKRAHTSVEPYPDAEIKYKPELYTASLFLNEDFYMPQQPGVGVIWLGSPLANLVKENFLPNFAREGDVEYVVSVAHTAPATVVSTSRNITVTANNNVTRSFTMEPVNGYASARISTRYFKTPASTIPANNRNTLRFDYNGTPIYPYLNFYEIHYKSALVPIDNEITFYSDIIDFDTTKSGIAEYNIKNFSGEIFGFDVTNMSNPIFIPNVATSNGNGTSDGTFSFIYAENSENIRKYFIASKLHIPQIERMDMLNLRNTNNKYANADVILITPNAFIESANKYAEYRTKQSNLKVSVVPIQKIYEEFSYGRLDLAAIRDYIQYCNAYWQNPPSFVILWGTGHYDYRNIYEPKPNFIPAYQSTNKSIALPTGDNPTTFIIEDGTGSYATDDFYVRVVGTGINSIPNIPIGRVPISSNLEGEYFIEKLDNFENRSSTDPWRRNIVILADDGLASGGNSDTQTHTRAGEAFANKIPKEFNIDKIYNIAYPVVYQAGGSRKIPKSNEEILNKCNINGTSLFLFTGHGSPNTLTHERTFPRDMVSQFTNTDKLYFFGAGSCEVARFDHSNGCMAADVVLQRNVAGIASFAATRVSGIGANRDLFVDLTETFFQRKANGEYYTIGQVCNMTKARRYNYNEAKMYVLLGDPTIKLHFPELSVIVDEVNGVKTNEIDSKGLNVPALSYLNLQGRIISHSDSILQSDFNGVISIILNEADIQRIVIEVYKDSNYEHTFTVNGATLNKSSYKVENGTFTAEFVIPGDISFSDANANLYLYAVSDDNRYAQGHSSQLIINSLGSIPNDYEGPVIDIKLDSRNFLAGDMVSKNPLLIVDLWDETGVNTSGLGIGHKIEAWINDNSNPIDLTNDFVSSLTDSRGGTILKHLYGIPAGKHKIKVSAWDVFNNLSVAETHFLTPSESEENILDVKMFPNPNTANSTTEIVIKYNIAPPINATITIVDALGSEVTTFPSQIMTTNTAIINWNNTTSDGLLVNSGTYYYRINFEFGTQTDRRSCEKFGLLGIIAR